VEAVNILLYSVVWIHALWISQRVRVVALHIRVDDRRVVLPGYAPRVKTAVDDSREALIAIRVHRLDRAYLLIIVRLEVPSMLRGVHQGVLLHRRSCHVTLRGWQGLILLGERSLTVLRLEELLRLGLLLLA